MADEAASAEAAAAAEATALNSPSISSYVAANRRKNKSYRAFIIENLSKLSAELLAKIKAVSRSKSYHQINRSLVKMGLFFK